MAKESDIESNITLEIDGPVSPGQLAKALNSFSALLNAAHKKTDDESAPQWTVQVKKGSNLLGYYSRGNVNPVALSTIENGLKQLEAGIDMPTGFNDSMIHNLRTLCDIAKDTKSSKTNVKIWLNKKPNDITMKVKSNIAIALAGEFEEYGAIEGTLEILDSHNEYQFAIYEPLYLKRITCSANDDNVLTDAYKMYEQRVEAEGMIKYTAHGIPYEIFVDKINPLSLVKDEQEYKLTRGILKAYV